MRAKAIPFTTRSNIRKFDKRNNDFARSNNFNKSSQSVRWESDLSNNSSHSSQSTAATHSTPRRPILRNNNSSSSNRNHSNMQQNIYNQPDINNSNQSHSSHLTNSQPASNQILTLKLKRLILMEQIFNTFQHEKNKVKYSKRFSYF